MLDKSRLTATRRRIIGFYVEELDGEVPLRALGPGDVIHIQTIPDELDRTVAFLRAGIVDPETHEPMFTEEEFPGVLNDWPMPAVLKIGAKLRELSGTDPKIIEELQGNSDETAKGGSPTGWQPSSK